MTEIIKVIKATGEIEPFSEEKVIRSLLHAGASEELGRKVVEKIKPHLYQNIPTFEIYSLVMNILKKEKEDLATKYNLKKAIMDLGPTGYPFEKFVAGVLRTCGHQVLINQQVSGKCVGHEIDIVAQNKEKYMIECKFHSIPGGRTDIKVALYTYARFLDVKDKGKFNIPWLITNTKVTQEVKTYAACVKMNVTAWEYPEGESLNDLVDKSGLYPITALPDLSEEEKKSLLERGIVFCKDLASRQAQPAPFKKV